MYRYDRIKTKEELLLPLRIKMENNIDNADSLLVKREPVVSFKTENFTTFKGKGSYIVLDFGKEIAGGIRIITRSTDKTANVRLTFGESLSECLSTVGKKNATNDHSTRDFRAVIPFMSDLTFGQTGFRFVKIELSDNKTLTVQNIFAVSKTQEFDFEATIKTNDKDLNKIIDTAIYTLKLNFQNGFIWWVKINELRLHLAISSVFFATAKIQKFHKTGTTTGKNFKKNTNYHGFTIILIYGYFMDICVFDTTNLLWGASLDASHSRQWVSANRLFSERYLVGHHHRSAVGGAGVVLLRKAALSC